MSSPNREPSSREKKLEAENRALRAQIKSLQSQLQSMSAKMEQQTAKIDELLKMFADAQASSEVAQLFIQQAVQLGLAQAEFQAKPATWQPVNRYGAKVQAHVIDHY